MKGYSNTETLIYSRDLTMPRPKSETTMSKHSFSIEPEALEYYKEVAWLNRTNLSALVRAALAAYVSTLPEKPQDIPQLQKDFQ